jgi:cardiolipin synthase
LKIRPIACFLARGAADGNPAAGTGLAQYELLVGSDAFWRRAEEDFRAAKRRLFVEAMTFEADRAGSVVGGAIAESPAADRRILVDHYTRFVVNDRFVWWPGYWRDPAFLAEIRDTADMFRRLRQRGIGVRLTNPVGPLLIGYSARNHKKMIVADDAAYIGGINFSDHNFAWHDVMVRIESREVADFLAADFLATYEGKARFAEGRFADVTLFALDGKTNHIGFRHLLALIAAAEQRICVVSPYLTFPFVEALEHAEKRGVAVQLITPAPNNKPLLRDYLFYVAQKANFDVRLSRDMSHAKAMLIDGKKLILGSTNFDFVSYHVEEEIVAVIENEELIASFRNAVIGPALSAAIPAWRISAWAGLRSHAALRFAEAMIRVVGQARRTASDWNY